MVAPEVRGLVVERGDFFAFLIIGIQHVLRDVVLQIGVREEAAVTSLVAKGIDILVVAITTGFGIICDAHASIVSVFFLGGGIAERERIVLIWCQRELGTSLTCVAVGHAFSIVATALVIAFFITGPVSVDLETEQAFDERPAGIEAQLLPVIADVVERMGVFRRDRPRPIIRHFFCDDVDDAAHGL